MATKFQTTVSIVKMLRPVATKPQGMVNRLGDCVDTFLYSL